MEKEREYIKLLEILVLVAEANKGKIAGEDDRILDAEGLLLKFFGHAASALYLFKSTTLSDIHVSFFDSASINVLGRASLETFLVFHYVFISPTSEDEKDFRYVSWTLAGLRERQKFPVQSSQGKRQLEQEREFIPSLQTKLKNNPCFKGLDPDQQEKLIKKGEWRLQSWTDIGLSAGLNDIYARAFYRYLCGYAHSGNLSVLQLRQSQTAESQKTLCSATLGLVMIAMANMIRSYCVLFPRSNVVLLQEEDGDKIVNRWIKIGATSIKEIEIDWEDTKV